MKIDYRIFDGPRGGLSFDFVPSLHPTKNDFGLRDGPDVFCVREEAFMFIEGMIPDVYPEWRNYCHWGITPFARETWFEIFDQFPRLRRDLRANVRAEEIVQRYVFAPALLPSRHRLHRKALLDFLDRFESRARSTLERYPYLLIWGI